MATQHPTPPSASNVKEHSDSDNDSDETDSLKSRHRNAHIARIGALFVRHGFFLVLKRRGLRQDAALAASGELHTMLQYASDDTLAGPSRQDGQSACQALMQADYLHTERFSTADTGADNIVATVDREFLPLFRVDLPDSSIEGVAERMFQVFSCPGNVIVVALVLLARVIRRGIPFTVRSAHRMLLGVLLVSLKMNLDHRFDLDDVAAVCKCGVETIVRIELVTLKALQFECFVHPLEYHAMLFSLRSCYDQLPKKVLIGTWANVLSDLELPSTSPRDLCPSALLDEEGEGCGIAPITPPPQTLAGRGAYGPPASPHRRRTSSSSASSSFRVSSSAIAGTAALVMAIRQRNQQQQQQQQQAQDLKNLPANASRKTSTTSAQGGCSRNSSIAGLSMNSQRSSSIH